MRRLSFLLLVFSLAVLPALAQRQVGMVGKPFTLDMPQMAGANACTLTPAGPPQMRTNDFTFKGTTFSGTPSKAGFYALKVHCVWNTGRGATQLVMIRVAPAKK